MNQRALCRRILCSPLALLLAGESNRAVSVCYALMWIGVFCALLPGLILFFFPVFLLWFGAFWFLPVIHATAVIKARKAGRRAPGASDYGFAGGSYAILFSLMLITFSFVASVLTLKATYRLREELDGWAKRSDHAASWGMAVIEGFPFDTHLRLTTVGIAGREPQPYAFTTPIMIMHASAWGSRVHVVMEDGVKLDMPGLALAFAGDAVDIDADFSPSDFIQARVSRVTGSGAAAGFRARKLSAFLELLRSSPSDQDAAHDQYFSAELDWISPPRAWPPLGNLVPHAYISGRFIGTWSRGSLPHALAAWRDNGGHIDGISALLEWDALEVDTYDGRFRLDEALQPTGSVHVKTKNVAAAIDALVAAGRASPQDGDLAKSALAATSDRYQDVSIEDGRLMLGATIIAVLPRIDWP